MSKKIIETSHAPAPIGPYSQATLHNNMLFVSGQIALDPTSGNLIGGDIQQETKQVMQNIKAILSEANMTFGNILKCSIFVKDMGDFAKINEMYGSFFDDQAPARETVEVSRLPKDVNVEISCIAAL